MFERQQLHADKLMIYQEWIINCRLEATGPKINQKGLIELNTLRTILGRVSLGFPYDIRRISLGFSL